MCLQARDERSSLLKSEATWIRQPRPRSGYKAIHRDEVIQCLVELRRGLRAGKRRDLVDKALEWLNDGTESVVPLSFRDNPSMRCREGDAVDTTPLKQKKEHLWLDDVPHPADVVVDEDERQLGAEGAL